MSPVDRKGNHYADEQNRPDAAVESRARTATSTSSVFNVEDAEDFEASLDITAASGTSPTLDLSLETTVDGTNWYSAGAFTQKTTTGRDARMFGPLGERARWRWAIGGTTPSFTFAVTVRAEV